MNDEQHVPSLKSRFMQPGEAPMVKLVSDALNQIGMHPVAEHVTRQIVAALRCGNGHCDEPPDKK